ncbi:MAG: hypothetical protein LC627_04285 [Verrucomicrobiaceae bacterium]|nr:hypothetical protein [Verrucomicrobiaceae bacterium]
MIDDTGQLHDYSVFGLKVRSSLPLPELFSATDSRRPDVIVSRGAIAEDELAPLGMSAVDGALILTIDGIGRYKIDGGHSITIDAAPEIPERNLRLFLLGSAFGALLHQRGLLPLHANAVEIAGKAVAFMGPSGAGKSTLAAWFHERGHRVIADDVCVVGFDAKGHPFAAPGLPRLRLWAEALKLMDRDASGLERSYVSSQEEKYDVPISPEAAALREVPLTAAYLLERGEHFAISPLNGVEAADAVFANTYRGAYLELAGGQEGHWRVAMQLVRAVPLYRAVRQWDLGCLDDQCEQLRAHAVDLVDRPATESETIASA